MMVTNTGTAADDGLFTIKPLADLTVGGQFVQDGADRSVIGGDIISLTAGITLADSFTLDVENELNQIITFRTGGDVGDNLTMLAGSLLGSCVKTP